MIINSRSKSTAAIIIKINIIIPYVDNVIGNIPFCRLLVNKQHLKM
ncbi:hypothetical protein CF65_02670 [Aggregatibacter actinomycetemcomitans HK1651]|nr:hypothetical protein CF65_02670 [Aggregatibacter actinomycetemcomitans HK1651]